MKKLFLSALIFSILLSSCEYFNKFDNYVESLEFKSGKYYCEENDTTVLYLSVNPTDSFNFYETEYEVNPEGVIQFLDSTDNYCIVKGLSKGSCIVTAKLSNKSAKCAVTVR